MFRQCCKGKLIAGTQTTLSTTRQRCKGNLIAGTQMTLSTTQEPSTPRGHPHCRHTDDADFNFAGFAGWQRLHHDGGIAKYWLEARSTTAVGSSPSLSDSIANFTNFAGEVDKVGSASPNLGLPTSAPSMPYGRPFCQHLHCHRCRDKLIDNTPAHIKPHCRHQGPRCRTVDLFSNTFNITAAEINSLTTRRRPHCRHQLP